MGCDADAVLLAEFDERIALEVGVCFDLVHSRLHFRISQAISSKENVIVAAK